MTVAIEPIEHIVVAPAQGGSYAFSFDWWGGANLAVSLFSSDASLNELALDNGTGWTATPLTRATGGTVTLLADPGAYDRLRIRRRTTIAQEFDAPPTAQGFEAALDRVVMQQQERQDDTGEAVRLPIGLGDLRLPVPGAGLVIGWNQTGTDLTLFAPTSSIAVDPDGAPVSVLGDAAVTPTGRSAARLADHLGTLFDRADATAAMVHVTAAAVEAASIPATVSALRTLGCAAAGDEGGALYLRVVSEPGHAGKLQSDDGAWWELAEATVTPQMFGAVHATDNGALIASALAFCAAKGAVLEFPARSAGYPVTTSVAISQNNITIRGAGEQGPIIWGSATGWLFDVAAADPTTTFILGLSVSDLVCYQKSDVTPTAGGCWRFRNATNIRLDQVFTRNFFIHAQCEGLARAAFTGCFMQGSSIFTPDVAVAGSAFVRLLGFTLASTTVIPCANIYMTGCEISGNGDGLANMEVGLQVLDCDGLWISNSYVGYAKTVNVQFAPAIAASKWTNIHIDAMIDGGNGGTQTGVQFTEPSAGFMTGLRNKITFSKEIRGHSSNGMTLNVHGLQVTVDGNVSDNGAFGIQYLGNAACKLVLRSPVGGNNASGDLQNGLALPVVGAFA